MRTVLLTLAATVLAGPLLAQDAEHTRPETWKVRFDRPGPPDTAVRFVDMPPGWHVTTGPAGILYDPARTASGEYSLESEIFLFPSRRRREAFGFFFGGRDLEGADQAYVYFLIRGDGQFIVKRREGRSAPTLVRWTPHDAILPMGDGEDPVKNVLKVDVGGESLVFSVNGTEVATVPRGDLSPDGIVGLRVNHALNLHVTSLEVTPSR